MNCYSEMQGNPQLIVRNPLPPKYIYQAQGPNPKSLLRISEDLYFSKQAYMARV